MKFRKRDIFNTEVSPLVAITLLMLGLLLIAFIIFLLPLALIWALNTLFSLSIAYSFINWVAAALLLVLFNGRGSVEAEKETESKD